MNCPDCGVAVGELHELGCDIEQCPDCGGQFIGCLCEGVLKYPRLAWMGEWPGKADAVELNLWCYWSEAKHKWIKCDENHPLATPDLNRLSSEARWDADQAKWVKK